MEEILKRRKLVNMLIMCTLACLVTSLKAITVAKPQ